MFVFSENLTFWWPVKPIEPDPDHPGKLIEREFEVLFELPTPDEANADRKARAELLEKVTNLDLTDEDYQAAQQNLRAFDDALALRRIKDWRKIANKDGVALPFSSFPKVYAFQHIKSAIDRAYGEAISEDKARLGN